MTLAAQWLSRQLEIVARSGKSFFFPCGSYGWLLAC